VANLGAVSSVRALYVRFRHLIHEGARFGVVGLVGLAITDGGANLLRYQAGMNRLSAVAFATVVATAVTFIGSRYWTFRNRERTGMGRETVLFFAVNGIGVIISEAPVLVTYPFHLDSGLAYNVALNGGIALATLFRYWSYKTWVWRAETATSAATVASGAAAYAGPATSVGTATSATPATPARPAPAHRHRRPAGTRQPLRRARLLYGAVWLRLYEVAKFSMVSASAFLFTGAGTNLLHFQAGVGPLTSNVIATLLAAAVSYTGNRYWTFRHRQRTTVAREGVRFFVLNGFGLAIQLDCLGLSTYVLGLHDRLSYNVALVAGMALGTAFRYWSYRKWVWQAPAVAQFA
jgi:putative flippase GtrA